MYRLEYDVIEKGSVGFLGIGMKQAVIEAWRKEEPEEEKQDIKEIFSESEILGELKNERPVYEKREKKEKTSERPRRKKIKRKKLRRKK